jgi:NADH:ubiquinone oxidoreductase subunit E
LLGTTKHAELHSKKGYINENETYTIAKKIEKGIRDLKNYLGEYNKYNFKNLGKIKYYIQPGDKYSL